MPPPPPRRRPYMRSCRKVLPDLPKASVLSSVDRLADSRVHETPSPLISHPPSADRSGPHCRDLSLDRMTLFLTPFQFLDLSERSSLIMTDEEASFHARPSFGLPYIIRPSLPLLPGKSRAKWRYRPCFVGRDREGGGRIEMRARLLRRTGGRTDGRTVWHRVSPPSDFSRCRCRRGCAVLSSSDSVGASTVDGGRACRH